MSVKAMSWVWEHSRAKGGSRLVLLALADHAGADGGDAWPSHATLVRRTLMTRRGVQLAISHLVEIGEIEVEAGAGRKGSHRYRLTFRSEPGSHAGGERGSPPGGEHSTPQAANGVRRGRTKFAGGELNDTKVRTTFAQSVKNPSRENSSQRPSSVNSRTQGGNSSIERTITAAAKLVAEADLARLPTPPGSAGAWLTTTTRNIAEQAGPAWRVLLAADPDLTAEALAAGDDRPPATNGHPVAPVAPPRNDPGCPRCHGAGWLLDDHGDATERCDCRAPDATELAPIPAFGAST